MMSAPTGTGRCTVVSGCRGHPVPVRVRRFVPACLWCLMRLFVSFIITVVVFCLSQGSAVALDAPKEDVILTLSGPSIGHPNVGKTAQFDLPMLEALPGRTGRMQTPWTEGTVQLSGPLLRAVLEAAGANGRNLKVRALNDYSADVPLGDATDLDTILALRLNGKLLSVREMGPIFLVYPFDKNPELYNEKYFSRSVWQIKEIVVE